MDVRRAMGENIGDREFLPVSPSDPIYLHPPAVKTSGSPSFALPPQFRMPFALPPPVPRFDGSVPISRPSAVRPIAAPHFFHGRGNEAGPSASFSAQVLDFTDSAIPSSQEPYETNSQTSAGVGNQLLDGEELQPRGRRRLQPVSGKEESLPATGNVVKTRFHWHEAATIALIEAKKEEADEDDARFGRDIMLSTDQKWKLIKKTDDPGESLKHNSGKRKKEVSKSANAIVGAMNSFSESFVTVQGKREEHEVKKQKSVVESEERHFSGWSIVRNAMK
ncbi:hypothetical protein R1sor_019671 [Riccia sorocarpa]|uniref:Uncharacterized protein n=1 Tax=Riccia sorocarpa TaxID=122646 RepID=A0ABD3IEW5_9MARC